MTMQRPVTILSLCAALGAFASACQKKDEGTVTPPPAAAGALTAAGGGDAAAAAKTVFAQRCTLCHGPEGKGDGPAAANLNPKPRNYGDATWQAPSRTSSSRRPSSRAALPWARA